MAPQQGAQAGEQDGRLDGLDHVVVGAGFEAEDVVEVAFLGGEHEDRRIGDAADFAAHVQAALAGEHEVEHHRLGAEFDEGVQGGVATVHLAYLEAVFGEVEGHQAGELLIVLDQHYLAESVAIHGCSSVGGRRGAL